MNTRKMIPYGRQNIDQRDIAAVIEILQSEWLTTGPMVNRFEEAFAKEFGAKYAVAVSSATAGLHAAISAIGVGPGDEVICPPLTFVASANCVVYQGARPVFADIDPTTLLLDPSEVRKRISPKTKAIVAVDYAGQPCDYRALREIAQEFKLRLISDACHAIGGKNEQGQSVGQLGDISVFSFHAVKHMTTGEGGMILTNDEGLARHMRVFRNHGITSDHRERAEKGQWNYDMALLGFNYRLTDFQCALGLSQLKNLSAWVNNRREIAQRYHEVLKDLPGFVAVKSRQGVEHAYHLFVVRVREEILKKNRNQVLKELRELGIGANFHYPALHLHSYYQARFGYREGDFPVSEKAANEIISLPIFPGISEEELGRVFTALADIHS